MRTSVLAVGLLAIQAAAATTAGAVVGPSTPGSPLRNSIVMVLNHRGTTAGFCTAVVLSPRVLLTAAHCVPPSADVRVDLPEAGPSPTLLPVDAIARHPGYRADAIRLRERSIDLALIRLPTPLPARFAAATLAAASGAQPGQSFVFAGYGLGREGEARSSGQLRSATLVAREPLSSVLLWATDPTQGGAGACTGDSGGPVTAAGTTDIAAMVVWSAGSGRHQCGALTQALWLPPYRSWIDGIMAGWQGQR